MNKFDEAEFKLHSVVHEITKDEGESETKSIYDVIDDLRFIKDALQSAKALETEHEALKKELAKSVGYCSKIQNEFNTLKNDVARFIELSKNPRNKKTNDIRPFDEWASEVIKLEIELFEKCNTKVGKEE